MAQIFISYSRADAQFISDLVPLLHEAYGVASVFYDEQIPGGTKWWEMILNEIAACDLFIYLCSNDSLHSPYCQSELREAHRLQKQILPVIVRPKTNYPFAGVDYGTTIPDDVAIILRDTNCIDLSKGFRDRDSGSRASAKLYGAINVALRKAPATSQPPLTPIPTSQPQVSDKKKRSWLTEPRAIIISAIITGVFAIVAVVVPMFINGQNLSQNQVSSTLTLLPTSTMQIVAAATSLPSETSAPANAPSSTIESVSPSPTHTSNPTATHTLQPTNTLIPTATLTRRPSNTSVPTATRTLRPTNTPTPSATRAPTNTPSRTPRPTYTPTMTRTPVPQSAILYEEDFDDGVANGWGTPFGTWTIETDESGNRFWRGTGPSNYPQQWLNNHNWTDYAFESRIRRVNGVVFVCLRANNGGSSFYNVYISDSGTVFADYDGTQYNTFSGTNFPTRTNTWYLVRFEVEGNQLRLFINNRLIATAQRDSHSMGSIGYYMEGGSTIDFDDIRVWSLN